MAREGGPFPLVCLVVLDGWGCAPPGPGNAVALARTPVFDRLWARFPHTTLQASGEAVGLPPGQMGNSEVGHLTIGAGRRLYQDLMRVNKAIEDGSFFANPALVGAVRRAKERGGNLHLLGLVSYGGVHSHIDHLRALLDLARRHGMEERTFVHAFTDGRDVSPHAAAADLAEIPAQRVATVCGRYYAMDRDRRWERVERAWRAMVLGEGAQAASAEQAVEASYAAGVTDEFVEPAVVVRDGRPVATVSEGDAVVFYNFRPDRAREITRAFVDPAFDGFERPVLPQVRFVCLTEYDPTIPAPVAFEKDLPCCVLADVIAEAGLRQLHIAETEKYAHVTFFLNGGKEPPKPGEQRILFPSPKVPTYDLQPEMSAPEVTRRLVEAIRADAADFYVVNYANCDMVGHTGVLEAAIKAVEAVDDGVGQVVEAIRSKGGSVVVTADHGNAERMLYEGGGPFTVHTSNPVPAVVVHDEAGPLRAGGILADVAPTVVDLLDLAAPDEWTGRSLLRA